MQNTTTEQAIPQAARMYTGRTVTEITNNASAILTAWVRFRSLCIARDLGIISSDQYWMALEAR